MKTADYKDSNSCLNNFFVLKPTWYENILMNTNFNASVQYL